MRHINKVIIHCSATPEGRDVSLDTIRQWHIKRGWSDIGYHYVILINGTIQEGRPVERAGAHCKPKDTRTAAQKIAMQKLLLSLTDTYEGITIHGHNEFSSKACPSFDVQTEL